MSILNRFLKNLHARIKENRAVFILYTLLRIMVVAALVRSIIIGNLGSAIVCILTLALFLIPSLLEGALKVDIPPLLQGILYCFIFAAEILGELDHYYTKFPIWDTLLHTLCGFLFAAVGFVLFDLLNRNSKNVKLSPFYHVLVAFCFSMMIAVMWEFIECGGDLFFGQDMQKDFIVQKFQSVKLDPDQNQQIVRVADIVRTEIYTGSGEVFTVEGGYLDIGILDTMKDMLVCFIGSIIFCIFGYIYSRPGSKGKVAPRVVEGLQIQAVDDPPQKTETPGAEAVRKSAE